MYVWSITWCWCAWTIIILTHIWSIIFATRDQRKLGVILMITCLLLYFLRLIHYFYHVWSVFLRGCVWSITCTYAWTIMFLICAWSIIFITPDQCKSGDTPDQSHVAASEQSCSSFALDQSFSLRLISVVEGTRLISHSHLRLISHDAWSVTYLYAWSVTTPDQRKIQRITPDQSKPSTPDQSWRLISVKHLKMRLISHDAWSA